MKEGRNDGIERKKAVMCIMSDVSEKPCAVEVDGVLECDGVSVNMLSEKCAAFSMPDTCMTFFSEPFESGPFRSEPQEDDWPGL